MDDADGSEARGHLDAILADADHRTRRLVASGSRPFHPPDFEGSIPPGGAGHRPGMESPHLVVDLPGGAPPVDPFVFPADIGSIGGPAMVLGHRLNPTGQQVREGFEEQFRSQTAQLIVEAARVVPIIDGNRPLPQNIPRVQLGHHVHDSDPRLPFPVDHGPMDRCSPAVFREQGRMHVDAAVAGSVQNGLGNDLAVSGGHHQIRLHCEHGTNPFRIAQLLRLEYG